MIGNRRIVTVCPAGRRRYMELLVPYILRERGVIDRHDFWLNTSDPGDIEYMDALQRAHPTFIRVVRTANSGTTPRGKPYLGTAYQIRTFYPFAADEDSVYVRLDDDIVYVSPGGIEAIAKARLTDREPFLIYPTIINNSIMTHFLQQDRVFGREKGTAEYELKGRGWHDPRLAEHLHRRFMQSVKRGESERFRVKPRTLRDYMTVSVNAISWLGEDMAECKNDVTLLEEQYLATDRPRALGRPNRIVDVATVAHFSYGEQRDFIDRTDLLQEYRRILYR